MSDAPTPPGDGSPRAEPEATPAQAEKVRKGKPERFITQGFSPTPAPQQLDPEREKELRKRTPREEVPRDFRPQKLKRLRQHTNPLAFQGRMEVPDWNAVLGGLPEELEIGFGLGELLLERAKAHPATRILGVDVRWAYVECVRLQVRELPEPRPRLHTEHAEGKWVLRHWIPEGSLNHAVVYFPDPWFKKKHAKRRFLTSETVALLARGLKPGGLLHVATDQELLGRDLLPMCEAEPTLRNIEGEGRFAPLSRLGAMSGREVKHLERGEAIWRITLEKRG